MTVVKVQKIPKHEISFDIILSKFCYYYPQYKYHEARKLPFKRITTMLNVAHKERAEMYFELVQIASAPHTKNGIGVKRLLDRYKQIIDCYN